MTKANYLRPEIRITRVKTESGIAGVTVSVQSAPTAPEEVIGEDLEDSNNFYVTF
jgi:hypothetical protein